MEQQLECQIEYLSVEDSAYLKDMSRRISQLRALHKKANFRPDSWQWLNDLKKLA